jgi:hypothetical protein
MSEVTQKDQEMLDLEREVSRRLNAEEHMQALVTIARARRHMKERPGGRVALIFGGDARIEVELGPDTAEQALNAEEAFNLQELALLGVTFGDWS